MLHRKFDTVFSGILHRVFSIISAAYTIFLTVELLSTSSVCCLKGGVAVRVFSIISAAYTIFLTVELLSTSSVCCLKGGVAVPLAYFCRFKLYRM